MKRLAIVSTHPIQYNAPLFRMLAAHTKTALHVFFTKEEREVRFDIEFGQEVTWDIPLTDGYAHSTFPCQSSAGRRALKQAIDSFYPHALLIYGWNPPGHLQCMRHFHGRLPVWFRGDSILDSGIQGWKRTFRRMVLRWVYRHVDHAFPVGQRNREYFLWAGMTEDQLTLAPHTVDAEFFIRDDENRRKEASTLRAGLGIPSDNTVFLFAGKINKNKQPRELAEAFSGLPQEQQQRAHLIFVGSGPLETELAEQFKEYDNVHFVGFQNQSRMPIWYRVADVLCLVSISETWGLAVNEAILCGCRILATDTVGCVPDLVAHQKDCHVVHHDAPQQWVGALNEMMGRKTGTPANAGPTMETVMRVIIDLLHNASA